MKDRTKRTPPPKRILIVDDHPVLRKGLVRLINSKPGFVICAEAGNASEAMALIKQQKPHLVIVDIGLPGASGLELTRSIRAAFPKLPILILSMHDEPLYATRALRAGALGYVIKQDAPDNIAAALRETLEGRCYISPGIAKDVMSDSWKTSASGDHADPAAILSDRELEIFQLIGSGHEVREISQALGVSPKTVDSHRTNIKQKLKLQNARQVARLAVQWAAQHEGLKS